MVFKFRLAASLRLAEQKLEKAQEALGKEVAKGRQMEEAYQAKKLLASHVLEKQGGACLKDPAALEDWHWFGESLKEILIQMLAEIKEQDLLILKRREELKLCKIETEKFKKLKEKQWQEFYQEELRKEQLIIDEIAQKYQGEI